MVWNFFNSDDVGRMCPGKRESVRMGRDDEGEKVYKPNKINAYESTGAVCSIQGG